MDQSKLVYDLSNLTTVALHTLTCNVPNACIQDEVRNEISDIVMFIRLNQESSNFDLLKAIALDERVADVFQLCPDSEHLDPHKAVFYDYIARNSELANAIRDLIETGNARAAISLLETAKVDLQSLAANPTFIKIVKFARSIEFDWQVYTSDKTVILESLVDTLEKFTGDPAVGLAFSRNPRCLDVCNSYLELSRGPLEASIGGRISVAISKFSNQFPDIGDEPIAR